MSCFSADLHSAKFEFAGKAVAHEASDAGNGKPLILLFHGASGHGLSLYEDQARIFASKDYAVVVPHYFDATKTSQVTTYNYKIWAASVAPMVKQFTNGSGTSQKMSSSSFLPRRICRVSRRAAGSQGACVAAIAEDGSLIDDLFYSMKSMSPLQILHGQQDNKIPVSNAQQLL